MSMCICRKCDAAIDSDLDPECFIEHKYGDFCLCEPCREKQSQFEDGEPYMLDTPEPF